MKEGQGRKRNRNESEETEEIKTFPPLPLPTTRIAGLAQLYANISWTPQWNVCIEVYDNVIYDDKK